MNNQKLLRTSPTFQEICLSSFFFFLFRSVPQKTNHPCELVFCGTERNHFLYPATPSYDIMFSRWPLVCTSVRLIVCKHFVSGQKLEYFIDGFFFIKFGMCNGVGHVLLETVYGSHAYIHYIYILITTNY